MHTAMQDDDELGVGISKPPRNTSKAMLPDSCAIRKSAHGRARLYTAEAGYKDMRCSSSITQHQHRHSLFHRHSQNGRLPEDFMRPTTTACFHCCHTFADPPVPIPKDYDAALNCFVVYGNFCSLACCKSHLCDTSSFNSGLQMLLIEKMGREIYGVSEIRAAPPRLTLQLFGGPYTIERFRDIGKERRVIEHSPPFVCAYHVIEEREQQHDIASLDVDAYGSVRGIRRPATTVRPPPPATPPECSQYEKFVAFRTGGEAQSVNTVAPNLTSSTRNGVVPSEASGTLAAFMR